MDYPGLYDDLSQYSQQMPGRKSGRSGEEPQRPGLTKMQMASGALQGLGMGLMSDELFKKYNRAGSGYAGLAADNAVRERLSEQNQMPGDQYPGDSDMAQIQARRPRLPLDRNMGGKLR